MPETKSAIQEVTSTISPTTPKPSPQLVEQAKEKVRGDKDGLATIASIDSVESNARFLGYLARYRSVVVAASRYLAFTSDVGEAFRPLVRPFIVTAAYGVSWAYVLGDVSWEGYKTWKIQQDPSTVAGTMVKRAVFQGVASMALPAFTIHSVVKYSARFLFSKSANPKIRMWGPTVSGLAVVPALPFMFDHPVERAVDFVWETVEENVLGRTHTNEKAPALFPGSRRYSSSVLEQAQEELEEEKAAEKAEKTME